jgi:hypothetical protein
MSLRPEPFLPIPSRRWPLAGAVVLLLAACSALQPPPPAPVAAPPAPPPAPAPVEPPAPPPPPAAPQPDPADAVARRLLAYHEQLRQFSPPELAQDITRLNAMIAANTSAASPSMVLELALALSVNRSPGDLARAVTLLDPLVRSTAPELAPWQPLARLLMGRLVDQRRLEDQLERQASQLRDAQRNLLQTNEKLEALKAIERSLNARPAGAASTPPASAPKAP